jgi:hypothetical protein
MVKCPFRFSVYASRVMLQGLLVALDFNCQQKALLDIEIEEMYQLELLHKWYRVTCSRARIELHIDGYYRELLEEARIFNKELRSSRRGKITIYD